MIPIDHATTEGIMHGLGASAVMGLSGSRRCHALRAQRLRRAAVAALIGRLGRALGRAGTRPTRLRPAAS